MPAPGDQHLNGGRTITNPFEPIRPHITEYTAQEIATLQSRLEKQLGPEYISSRPGPSGQKIHYVAAEKCIQLANEVFGFNGWSSQIMDMQVDYVDELSNGRINIGLSVIVRVTLKDGTFHEDVGYGQVDNAKTKAAAFEKAKKEGTTDGLKRALRNFGNVLGNCIYDKEYVSKVVKMKAQPTQWDAKNLHRHSTYVPPKEIGATPQLGPAPGIVVAKTEEKSQAGALVPSISTEDTFEDEFGDDFDEADFNVADPDSHPDEVVLSDPSPAKPPVATSHFNNARNGNSNPNVATPNQNRPPMNRPQPTGASARPTNGPPHVMNNTNVPPHQPQTHQPHTPNARFTRSSSRAASITGGPGSGVRPQLNQAPNQAPQPRSMQPPAPPINPKTGQVLNQPSRTAMLSAPSSPANLNKPIIDEDNVGLPPQGQGFFSARAVAKVAPEHVTADTTGAPPPLPTNLAVFNPHAESPSIPRTPGIDHKSSKAVLHKDLKAIISSSQSQDPAVANNRGVPNIVNPQLDAARRIGAPGGMSPGRGSGGFKLPTKRPVDMHAAGRAPLVEMPANGSMGGDVKRQRLSGEGFSR